MFEKVVKKERKPVFESFIDDVKNNKDPDFFPYTGTQIYVGKQGSGKTISAVKHVFDVLENYPKAILVTNLNIVDDRYVPFDCNQESLDRLNNDDSFLNDDDIDLKPYFSFSTIDELGFALKNINNEKFGVIYLIDEIHTYFNALDSKNIPPYVFAQISQQRKQRKLIIGTSQLFLRIAKPFREQGDNMIMCKTYFGFITKQSVYDAAELEQDYDGSLIGTKKKTGYFYHTKKLRQLFDTYQVINHGSLELIEPKKPEIEVTGKFKKFKKVG